VPAGNREPREPRAGGAQPALRCHGARAAGKALRRDREQAAPGQRAPHCRCAAAPRAGGRAVKLVCGVDEAGRGPLAGPVYAAAVILAPGRRIAGLADSKALTPQQREELAHEIRERAAAWSVASASVEEIDTLNILQASLLAMRRAVQRLSIAPERVVVDGLHTPAVGIPARAVVGGDARIAAISA